jgi:hypothetical protein
MELIDFSMTLRTMIVPPTNTMAVIAIHLTIDIPSRRDEYWLLDYIREG